VGVVTSSAVRRNKENGCGGEGGTPKLKIIEGKRMKWMSDIVYRAK
jgi:hypothetical protein